LLLGEIKKNIDSDHYYGILNMVIFGVFTEDWLIQEILMVLFLPRDRQESNIHRHPYISYNKLYLANMDEIRQEKNIIGRFKLIFLKKGNYYV
jgi:hypothetical protein